MELQCRRPAAYPFQGLRLRLSLDWRGPCVSLITSTGTLQPLLNPEQFTFDNIKEKNP